jgi:two-component system, sensor histidine kinase and response regulator
MDVNMPVMNGIEATQAIRALGEKFRKTPIIGLTANVLEEYVRRCREAGMVRHVAKPFTPQAVFGAMAEALRGAAPGVSLPEATPPAYTVVGQKKVLTNEPKSMNEVLEAMRDELGHEYLLQTLANDLQEVRGLLEKLITGHRGGDFDGLTKAAHDLKSVSGLIGMQASSRLAAQIQDDCLNGDHSRLDALVTELAAQVPAEAVQAEGIVRDMAAA